MVTYPPHPQGPPGQGLLAGFGRLAGVWRAICPPCLYANFSCIYRIVMLTGPESHVFTLKSWICGLGCPNWSNVGKYLEDHSLALAWCGPMLYGRLCLVSARRGETDHSNPAKCRVWANGVVTLPPPSLARGCGPDLDALLGSGGRSDPHVSMPTFRLVS